MLFEQILRSLAWSLSKTYVLKKIKEHNTRILWEKCFKEVITLDLSDVPISNTYHNIIDAL